MQITIFNGTPDTGNFMIQISLIWRICMAQGALPATEAFSVFQATVPLMFICDYIRERSISGDNSTP